MNDEEKQKLLLDSFGKMLPKMNAAMWAESAELVREAERAYMEVASEWMLYNQCAYGL